MILIIGNSIDRVPKVIQELKRMGAKKIVLFKADKCLEKEAIGFSLINTESRLFADINRKEITLNDVSSIWYWKPLLPKVLRNFQPAEHQTFIYQQFLALWSSIASILADRKWVNNYYKIMEAERKPYQLKMASEIGFEIPDTLITSNPDKAMAFWEHCNRQMIIKTLWLTSAENSMIYTHKVTEELLSKIERIKSSPVIFQRQILKKHELRITVVGDNVFAAKIESENKIDWRRGKTRFKRYIMSDAINEKCLKFIKKLDLKYGCIDMIITPDERHVFLEINPNGQYAFVEKHTGMPISRAIAYLLVK